MILPQLVLPYSFLTRFRIKESTDCADTTSVTSRLPFTGTLLLAACLSLSAVVLDRQATVAGAEAPALEGSAVPALTSGFSNAAPTVVTQSQPPRAAVAGRVSTASTPAPGLSPSQVLGLPSNVARTTRPASNAVHAQSLVDAMNAARVEAGFDPFTRDSDLDAVALVRARDLVEREYFGHYAPDGASAFTELGVRGIPYRLAGENLARNNYPAAESVTVAFEGLMTSPGHRANILEARFRLVGVAAIADGSMWYYVTVFID